jgi:hypothetical protein
MTIQEIRWLVVEFPKLCHRPLAEVVDLLKEAN